VLPDVSVFTSIRDRGGEIIDFAWSYANVGASSMTGYSASELIGHTFRQVLPDHGPTGMFEVCRELVETGDPYEESTLWSEDVRRDGEERRRAFDVRATKVHDGFVIVMRDVTALREQEDRLAQLETERQDLNNLKNEFVDIVAHDLRTPLTVADGFADLLVDEWEEFTDPERRDLVRKIKATLERLDSLSNDILEVSRIESDGFTFDMQPFDLEDLVRTATDEIVSLDPHHPCEVHCEGDIPNVLGDRDRLWRVLTNLLSNAFKNSPDASPVLVTIESRAGFVHVAVADQGIGISLADQAKLFERFSRIRPADGSTQPKGTGLGLFISKSFVDGMGGTISVVSRPGSGSTFTFSVPIHTPSP
jgi:PAS domain S-box-containing protein